MGNYDQEAFSHDTFSMVEFAENPEPRCPCILLLDNSGSMSGSKLDQLNAGLKLFANELQSDSMTSKRVELAIITFGPVELVQEFTTADTFCAPNLSAQNDTPMGKAIVSAIDLLNQRKSIYKDNGINYYRPWIFLITDGEATDKVEEAINLIRDGEKNKSFMFYAVGVDNANMTELAKISSRPPLKLKGLSFKELFMWLSNSLSSVSRSVVGEVVPLENPVAPNGWAYVD